MGKILTIAVLLLAFSTPAQAAYKPGTVGYLYDECLVALKDSATLAQLQNTVCGGFAEGYFSGVMASGWDTLKAPPSGECAAEKQKEYERINNRTCANFPKPDPKNLKAGEILKLAVDIVSRWITFEKSKTIKADPMKRDASKELGRIITPGPFCDHLSQSYPERQSSFVINDALNTIRIGDYLDTMKGMSLAAKKTQCEKDVAEANGDSAKFVGSRCGAEIAGFIAGIHSTAHLQKNRTTPSPQCKKEIDRLYRSLNVTETMCVTRDTNPLFVAEVFLARIKSGAIQVKSAQNGSIGYQAIYKGFLCAEGRR